MRHPNRRYLILTAAQAQNIDFDQVLQTSSDTLRYSLDNSKTFVKYNIDVLEEDEVLTWIDVETQEENSYTRVAGTYGRPSVYENGMTEYTHSEMITILNTSEWSEPVEDFITP